jgi:hypothetical protein
MLTGYNTDVAYEGVTYHVQTEDKGVENPIILSLVYCGGTILAAKRSGYSELVNDGVVDEKGVGEMLERQHRIIIAAIRAGKIEQLAKRSAESAGLAAPSGAGSAGGSGKLLPKAASGKLALGSAASQPPEPTPSAESGPLPDFNLDQILAGYLQTEGPRERMSIELLTSPMFVAGEQVRVRAAVLFDGHRPADNAAVKLQIVGTGIKPQSFAAQTDQSGLVNFTVTLPTFTAGTAALILRASEPKGQEVEVKFLIRRR